MTIKSLSNASRSDVMEHSNVHTLLNILEKGYQHLMKYQLPLCGHSGQTFTCNLCVKSFVTASTIFYKNTFCQGLDGSTVKWDMSKSTLLIFSHILLDFQCLKYRSYSLSEYSEHLWLTLKYMASICHLKLYSFGLLTLYSHIIYIVLPVYQIQKHTALQILFSSYYFCFYISLFSIIDFA
jgi:hypothetical protein